MGKRRWLVLATFLAVFGLPATAGAQNEGEELLGKVRQKYEEMSDAEIHFTQKVRFPLARIDQTSSATLFLKKGHKYRVETQDQLIVTDGATVWSYTPANHQVVIDRFKEDQRSMTPEKILTGAAGGAYTPVYVGRGHVGKYDTAELKLTPRDEQSIITLIRLWIDEKDDLVRQVELTDANGKQTTYLVQQAKLNAGIPDSRFAFQPPHGVDVVDLR